MPSETCILLPDLEATYALAAELASRLQPGSVLALEGDLGAGKTELVRGLARALGVPAGVAVCSPSYLLLNRYPGGRLDLAHFDAYFMASADDLERAGFEELRRAGWALAVEWADRVQDALPADALHVALSVTAGGAARRARIRRGDATDGPSP